MMTPEDLRYSSDHEWVRVEGRRARLGITDYAQDALGDVVFVQLPAIGDAVVLGATFAEVESTKSVSDIFAPIGGTVVEVNDQLVDAPELVNSDPYGAGWIAIIEFGDPAELGSLMSADAYRTLTEV
jgi:glycine cleavage system H protein